MKKLKLFKPIMVASAVATPIPMLATSCSSTDFETLAADLKNDQITEFLDFANIRRETYAASEMFEYIWERMADIADEIDEEELWQEPTGYDLWSAVPEVQDVMKSELDTNYSLEIGGKTVSFNDYDELVVDRNQNYKDYGNLWYDIPAVGGEEYEKMPPVIVQSHMDMNIAFPGETGGDEWKLAHYRWLFGDESIGREKGVNISYDEDAELMASDEKTSLGADNGLGIALMFSLAKNYRKFNHCKIRLLFTCDESGSANFLDPDGEEDILASGADLLFYDQLKAGKFKSKQAGGEIKEINIQPDRPASGQAGEENYFPFGPNFEFYNVISLDGKTKSEVFQSAAGVHECHLNRQFTQTNMGDIWDKFVWDTDIGPGKQNALVQFDVSGLTGGHSGYDINNGLASALEILVWCLNFVDDGFRLVYVKSGDSPYAICDHASAVAILPYGGLSSEAFEQMLANKQKAWTQIFKTSFPRETNLTIKIKEVTTKPGWLIHDDVTGNDYVNAITNDLTEEIIQFSKALKFGPVSWFADGEVQTSCNYAPLTLEFYPVDQEHGIDEEIFKFGYDIISRSADDDQLNEFTDSTHLAIKSNLEHIIEGDPEESPYLSHVSLPVWEAPETEEENDLLNRVLNTYKHFLYQPTRYNSHAWLEIASFPRIFNSSNPSDPRAPYLPNMVCFGPTIEETHTINETVWTDTINSYIKVLLYVVNNTKGIKPLPIKQ